MSIMARKAVTLIFNGRAGFIQLFELRVEHTAASYK